MSQQRETVTFTLSGHGAITIERLRIVAVHDNGPRGAVVHVVGSQSFSVAEDYRSVKAKVFGTT